MSRGVRQGWPRDPGRRLPALPQQTGEQRCVALGSGRHGSRRCQFPVVGGDPGTGTGIGNALRFTSTAAEAGGAPDAIPLLATVSMRAVEAMLADRAYDSDAILGRIVVQKAVAVIPSHPIDPAPNSGPLMS